MPPPPLLVPAHDIQNMVVTIRITSPAIPRPARPAGLLKRPNPIINPGSSHSAMNPARLWAAEALALVEMFKTTATAEFPGVTGVDGLKMHCACGGNPAVQARLTAPVNDDPNG